MTSFKVLVVEDRMALARLLADMLREVDCAVAGIAPTVADALDLAGTHRPDVALVDLTLPDGSGADLINRLQSDGVFCAIVSGFEMPDSMPEGLADVPWLEKPVTLEVLDHFFKVHAPAISARKLLRSTVTEQDLNQPSTHS